MNRASRLLGRLTWGGALAALPLLAAACGGKGPARAPSASRALVSAASQRESVNVTVYGGDFALVRDVRNVDLGTGTLSLEFQDVPAHVQPETVHVRSLTSAKALQVFEQNYRYDLLTPEKLLDKYVGRKVRLYRWNEAEGREDGVDAEVLAAPGGSSSRGGGANAPVFRIGGENGEVTTGFPGQRIAFPEVPANLIAKPSLVWLLGSDQARQKVEVSYITQGLDWHADYVFVLEKDKSGNETQGDLTGWVTLANQSGTTFHNARLKLVAGDVQRVMEQGPPREEYAEEDEAPRGGAASSFKEEGFFEYHLYALDQPTDLLDREQKQLGLLSARGVGITKRLVLDGQPYVFQNAMPGVAPTQKLSVRLEVENREKNSMGMPLPKGIVRVYTRDSSGAAQFVGEDHIDHTARDEMVKVKLGEAFDVVAERVQKDYRVSGSCGSESAWEIALRNHKDVETEVDVVEPAPGDWELLQQSHPSTKIDAKTFRFRVKVPARGETKITYRLRTRWC